ncbi:hypothetical protein B0J13DRAFT_555192 [Dactylonectria estremocensis]|uniref:Secreted protein n=1 Tax=Dactylonectria estremocensis TaxID=1079267 RepID=A0A9P9J1B6_9HYPO|nr:hypothetical protein B0J13DRAFT_555192 [Dactylonectria estremocensis]
MATGLNRQPLALTLPLTLSLTPALVLVRNCRWKDNRTLTGNEEMLPGELTHNAQCHSSTVASLSRHQAFSSKQSTPIHTPLPSA